MPMTTPENRLKILANDEIQALYTYLPFTDEDRQLYFSLFETEGTAMRHLPVRTRIYFILQLGYFKAQKQFLPFSPTKLPMT
jgi:hypothetical protein